MATKNDVTGDTIRSKVSSKEYQDNWERIFGDKEWIDDQLSDNPTESVEEDE